ncbi:hypothetical protein BDP81DRAFT_489945 [Colletotrichum phormii]|uniref:Methyltransferase domain-containing protein n=1 Tax=Colletotrichum phormii TaxID=359342 RepID=A0AAJ0EDX6_9PEZI|nr:uncharacterized protein BDP81DRAFT_489945 [Colletotrichum phormii]KAK1636412.1 hypothetical protein BDP81DRAFT_489945 [Colletotrichum phormii]
MQKAIRLLKVLDRWALFDLGDYPIPTFAKGRICLLGDAAHASTPHQGAGAGICIEDAAVMASLLADEKVRDSTGVVAAFAAFDASRRERGEWLIRESRRAGELYDLRTKHGKDFDKLREEVYSQAEELWNFDLDGNIRDALEDMGRRLNVKYLFGFAVSLTNQPSASNENLPPKRQIMPADFDKQSYWGERFASETNFEWLTSSATLMSIVDPCLTNLDDSARILQLGFGTSDLQNHIRERGFQDITNIDFEPRAIDRGRMLEKQVFGDVKMRYLVADATQLQLTDKYDFIIDKCTADAISCGGEEPLLRMANGVRRHLADGGFWISLSYSFCRFDVENLPFHVDVIAKIPTPKLKATDPDVYHWCYLLTPKTLQ